MRWSGCIDSLAALEFFIEFWLGSRKDAYGIADAELSALPLPDPLQRLYSFAGNWPGKPYLGSPTKLLSSQDHLRTVDELEFISGDRVEFLDENQGNWSCATATEGSDPPVWWSEEYYPHRFKEPSPRLLTDSLSAFLVCFCLQEILLATEFSWSDTELSPEQSLLDIVKSRSGDWQVLCEDAPYVRPSSFYLCDRSILIGVLDGWVVCARRDEAKIDWFDEIGLRPSF